MDLESSEEIFDIKEFYDRYANNLPKVIVVRHGYYGNTAMENFETGQVIRVEGSSKQERVVAKDKTGRHLSLSVHHPIKCCFVDKKMKTHGKPMELAKLLEKHKLPFNVKFGETDLHIFIGAVKKKADEYGPITLESVYEERFMMGNNVENGSFIPDVIIIPLYVKAQVSVVTGFKCDKSIKKQMDAAWQWFVSSMDGKAKQTQYTGTKLTTEIAFYNPGEMVDESSEGVYDVISPAVYGSLLNRDRGVTYDTLERTSKTFVSFGKNDVKTQRLMSVDSGIPLTSYSSEQDQGINTGTDMRGILPGTSTCPPKVPPRPSDKLKQLQHGSMSEDVAKTQGTPDVGSDLYKILGEMRAKRARNISTPPEHKDALPTILPKPTASIQPSSDTDYNDSGISEDISVFKRPEPIHRPATKPELHKALGIHSMTVHDVSDLLARLNLNEHVDSFRDNLVDGEILSDLNKELLTSDFGFTNIQALRLNKFIQTGHIPR